ncbi:MAG: sigma-54-dependent Fis family transcriptional regulator [Acidobacteria bacterium]|nr:sigma-54-dependent Fis family transcriptional regulator [Acidobacteriota bacterium]MBI3663017.1 sigma-54-dependent Fis family transcriptional regulator [Acidobacteriota bacterium]
MNQVLVVDDEAAMRTALEANFRRQGWKVTTACGTQDALAKFRYSPCPLVITDMRMPDGDGLRVMEGVRAMSPNTAFIFLTAFGNVPEAVDAMRKGACDYLVKPVSFDMLEEAAERILGRATEEEVGGGVVDLIGKAPNFRALIECARLIARSDMDVLIEAESGTGKELLSRLVHRLSPRREGPFIAVNCAAFPEHLLESELFGHVRGAFTGATASKPGKFELANGGTLLLDEVTEMPLALQPKLLRVLQEREVDRLGDTRSIHVDVRVIATTNRPMEALVQEGKFRSDLYYRLNVVPLTIPPLRERREDIPVLAEHFLRKHASRAGATARRFSPELLERIKLRDWPGNVRELENFVRRSLALATEPVLGAELLPDEKLPVEAADSAKGLEPGRSLRDVEQQLLEITLQATNGNRTRAAEMLGVSLRTIRNKIREYGLPPRGAA